VRRSRPQVRCDATLQERLDHYTDKSAGPEGCWLWTGGLRHGYGALKWQDRSCNAHRLAFEAANGPIPAGLCILHRCDRPQCVNPAHLFAGSQLDNMRDMRRKGRGWIAAGELNPMAKLTAQTVMAIRAAKGSQRKIAKRFAVSQALVSLIKLGDRWRHLPAADAMAVGGPMDRDRDDRVSRSAMPT